MEKATFGAGCFWGVEEFFRHIPGVIDTEVGYMGGMVDHPTYEEVCTGKTGHAEVVHLCFDPQEITYEQLLWEFFHMHDPTTLNRQGPDHGTQYRSVIFCHDSDQCEQAKAMKERLDRSGKFHDPIVTEITPASTFYRAEEYHQRYLQKRGQQSCHPINRLQG